MKIVFTGGGTAGHAIVNTILIPYFKDRGYEILYIGSLKGMEKNMAQELDGVKYYGISTGKLRRYFSIENLLDIFRLIKGFFQAFIILRREKPSLVYSSSGYVSVPVVWAAYFNKINIVIRETDYSVGLANKLCIPFAKRVYVTFPDTKNALKNVECIDDGMIIRTNLYNSFNLEKEVGNEIKPICLIIGGSLGAKNINEVIWENLNELTSKYSIIHICGSGNYNKNIKDTELYKQVEFVKDIGSFYSLADVIITRCGSNAISEGLLLGKRLVCIPLGSSSSRGEQMQNAKFAMENGTSVILRNDDLTSKSLIKAIDEVLDKELNISYKINKEELMLRVENHIQGICNIINETPPYMH